MSATEIAMLAACVCIVLAVAALAAWRLDSALGTIGAEVRARLDAQEAAERAHEGHPLLGRMVVVNTHRPDDQSIQGLLAQVTPDVYLLRAPSHLVREGGQAVRWEPIPADVTVERRHVAWMVEVVADAEKLK